MPTLRHLFILAHDSSSLSGRLRIALDRHLSRGDQIEIVQDRRHPPADSRASERTVERERRRAGVISEQLRTQGYAILSREEEAPASPPARSFERAPVARGEEVPAPMAPRPFERPPVARVERARISHDDRRALREDLLEDSSADPDDRDDFDRPRRRGGFAAVIVLAALAAGLFFFSTQPARDRLAGTLTPAPPASERATPPGPARPPRPATEEPARTPSAAPDLSARTPLPAAPSPTTPAPALPSPAPPALPSPAPPPSATREAAPVEPAAPAPSAPASLPPRRAEAPAAERPPAAAPQSVRTQRLPDFPGLPRVEVSRASSADTTTFTVRLADPSGRPLPDAQVWLRQKVTDGVVREIPLEPVSPAGSYRAAVPGGARRADELTVRVVLGGRRMEMPVPE